MKDIAKIETRMVKIEARIEKIERLVATIRRAGQLIPWLLLFLLIK